VSEKTIVQSLWDFVGMPFRLLLFDQNWLPRFGWTTLGEERLNAVLPHVRGRLLDIGAGPNTLVKRYGSGMGVDVHDWGGGAEVVKDTSCLPYDDQTFDTVTFVACLNHIPYRGKADGRLIITMIDPILGGIGHALWWYSEDKHRGGMQEGEVGGIWTRDLVKMCQTSGFRLRIHKRFVYGMNNLYVFEVAGRIPQMHPCERP